MLCMYLKRLPSFSANSRLSIFLQFISHIYHLPLFRDRLVRNPSDFIPQAMIVVALRATGFLKGDYECCLVQQIIDNTNVCLLERPPYALLELRHLLDLGRFSHRLSSYGVLYRASIAAKLTKFSSLVSISDRDAYSVTHTLFFLSDFGFQSIKTISPAAMKRILPFIEILLGMYIQAGDWDLVGELMLSCHCLRSVESEFYRLGWRALIEAQWDDGAVPGPYYDHSKAGEKKGEELRDYFFSTCYHTTLVSALVGALCPYTDK